MALKKGILEASGDEARTVPTCLQYFQQGRSNT